MFAVDIIASQYGWTQDYIYYSLYYEDVKSYIDLIIKRKKDNYLIQLNISSYPHLSKQDRKTIRDCFVDESKNDDLEFHKQDFEIFKAKINKRSGIKVNA